MYFRLGNRNMKKTIGLDLGGTFLKAGVISQSGEVAHKARYSIDPSGVDRVFDTIGLAVRECAAASGDMAAVGLGIPGILDRTTWRMMSSPNLHCLDGQDMNQRLSGVCPYPFAIDNDANCAAWGEYSAGAGSEACGARPLSFVLLTIGTGVGGGIVLDGRLWHGARGYAGEPGHIVIERDGLPCNCGGRGCLETRVSAGAILRAYGERGGHAGSAEDVAGAASRGDRLALESLAEVGRDLGIGIAAIINLLNPELVAVGGGVMGAGELLLGPARTEASARAFSDSFGSARIVAAALGNDAGMIGAGLMARERLK